MSNKIPDMPDFLKKEEKTVNVPAKPTPPPVPEAEKQEEPKVEKKIEKKKFTVSSKTPLIEFRNDQGEMVPSEAPPREVPEKSINDYFPPMVGQLLLVLFLGAVGTGLFYYYQAEAYKDKFQAIDSRVLNLTKEIAGLNQENNSLSGRVVNLQKELEGKSDTVVLNMQKQIQDLNNQILIYKTVSGEITPQTPSKPVESADPVPLQEAKVTTPATPPVNTSARVAPTINTVTPKKEVVKAVDASINYEPRLRTPGEQKCLQYYRTENLKKCQGRNSKYNRVGINSKQTPDGVKLTYQCQGPGEKPLNFKYGPMEIYNNCAGR